MEKLLDIIFNKISVILIFLLVFFIILLGNFNENTFFSLVLITISFMIIYYLAFLIYKGTKLNDLLKIILIIIVGGLLSLYCKLPMDTAKYYELAAIIWFISESFFLFLLILGCAVIGRKIENNRIAIAGFLGLVILLVPDLKWLLFSRGRYSHDLGYREALDLLFNGYLGMTLGLIGGYLSNRKRLIYVLIFLPISFVLTYWNWYIIDLSTAFRHSHKTVTNFYKEQKSLAVDFEKSRVEESRVIEEQERKSNQQELNMIRAVSRLPDSADKEELYYDKESCWDAQQNKEYAILQYENNSNVNREEAEKYVVAEMQWEVVGEVSKIDIAKNQLIIKNSCITLLIDVDNKTSYENVAELAQIRERDNLNVFYKITENGMVLAKEIYKLGND